MQENPQHHEQTSSTSNKWEDLSAQSSELTGLAQEIAEIILRERGIDFQDKEIAQLVKSHISKILVFTSMKELRKNLEVSGVQDARSYCLRQAITAPLSGVRGSFIETSDPDDFLRIILYPKFKSFATFSETMVHETYHATDAIVRRLSLPVSVPTKEDRNNSGDAFKKGSEYLLVTSAISMLLALRLLFSILQGVTPEDAHYITPAIISMVMVLGSLNFNSHMTRKYNNTETERTANEAAQKFSNIPELAQALARVKELTRPPNV